MRIEISYNYSKLDSCHQFGIEFFNIDSSFYQQYSRWIYYYLGALIEDGKGYRIHPYNINHKGIKKYKYCNDARRQAKTIFNYISRKSQK